MYLHPTEFARLEGIIPVLREQTLRALGEALAALNRSSRLQRLVRRGRRKRDPEVQNAAREWHVEFLPDADGELNEGDLLIDSELMLPAQPDLGVGERTRRLQTRVVEGHSTARTFTSDRSAAAHTGPVLARLSYADQSGPHAYDIIKDSVTIGRGGRAYPVDVRLVSVEDVSREHARIRRDPRTGRFFLIDLSSLGTTLNGRHVPKGHDEVNGTKRENGTETLLPDVATIGLAGAVSLEFRKAE